MALLNEILGQAARFQQGLTKKFQITGGSPSPQLTPEITPVYPIPFGPEDLYLQQEKIYRMGFQLTSGIGFAPFVQLRNPANSNAVIVVERLLIQSTIVNSTISVQMGVSNTDAAVLQGTIFAADGRLLNSLGGVMGSVGLWSSTVTTFASGVVGGECLLINPVDLIFYPSVPYVLTPGTLLKFFTDTASCGLSFACAYRERPLTPPELLV